MPRHVKERNLSTRNARDALPIAHKPYFRSLDEGVHLGYRKSNSGTAWVLRWYVGSGNYKTANLEGRPDDVLAADGATVLTWNQAQATARKFFEEKQREDAGLNATPAGPYTVKDALTDYMAAYRRKGGKSADSTQWTIDGLIAPKLGGIVLPKLKRRDIEGWLDELASTSPRLRTKRTEKQKFRAKDDSLEAIRRRRSSANRVLTTLKAALNHAHAQRKVSSDDAWASIKPFREVDAARVRYLNDKESKHLVNSCTAEFKPLVQAALLTGCRYGELVALVASDYSADAGSIHIRVSKSGKPRHVVLTEEGKTFFKNMTAGKASDAPIFAKEDGTAWGKSHQQRPFKATVAKAKLGALTFHELRHTYASRLVMAGAPLPVIAAQLGHTDTRMVEKHYGHLAPSYVADTVRATFTSLGIVEETNVTSIGDAR